MGSPRPWSVSSLHSGNLNKPGVIDATGEVVASPLDPDDAALAVEAVNEHERLHAILAMPEYAALAELHALRAREAALRSELEDVQAFAAGSMARVEQLERREAALRGACEKNRNVLVRDGRARGMVDHHALAVEITERMNAEPSAVSECARVAEEHDWWLHIERSASWEHEGDWCAQLLTPDGDIPGAWHDHGRGYGPTPEAAAAALVNVVEA